MDNQSEILTSSWEVQTEIVDTFNVVMNLRWQPQESRAKKRQRVREKRIRRTMQKRLLGLHDRYSIQVVYRDGGQEALDQYVSWRNRQGYRGQLVAKRPKTEVWCWAAKRRVR